MVVNGWRLYVHPLFHDQLIHLVEQVEALAKKNPAAYKEEAATKLLATINRLIREIIPRDPNAPEFRQGNTLGKDNRHSFRAKFHQRYRLSYRFATKEKSSSALGLTMRRPSARRDRKQTLTPFSAGCWKLGIHLLRLQICCSDQRF